MDLSLNWAAALAGIALPVFDALDELVDDCLFPNPLCHPGWSRREFMNIVAANDHPEAIPALWHSVVSIWRLQTLTTRVEEDAKMLELWQAHTSAWLVRTIVANGRIEGLTPRASRPVIGIYANT